jgi:hypothetical protein
LWKVLDARFLTLCIVLRDTGTPGHTVGMVTRFTESPQVVHWTAVKRIFRYLQGTKSHGVRFKSSGNVDFECYSDVDWVGD